MLSRLSSFSGPLSKLFTAIKGFTLNGLILRYEIKDNDSYSGTNTVTDLIGNSNATLLDGPTYSINGYLNFDGVNDHLFTDTSLNSKLSPVNTSTIISCFVWVYPMDNGVILAEQGTTTIDSSWFDSQIEIVSGVIKFRVWASLTGITSTIPTSFNKWYYVGFTYDGTTLRGYVNSQLAGTLNLNRQAPFSAGRGLFYTLAAPTSTNLGDGTYARMKLGAFQVYNTALSGQQVLNNYNAQKSNYIYSEDMLIWIDANDPQSFSGGSIFDISGNNYTHSLTSGATLSTVFGFRSFDCATASQRVVVNGTGPTLPTTGYTYVVWARLISDNTSFRTLIYTNSPKYTPITIPSGTNTLGYWDSEFRSSGYDLTSSVDVWVQYAVVGDSSSQTFYINGSQVGSPIAYGSGGRTHWGLGNNDIVPQPFGYVSNMILYNKKLTQAEIKQNYDALKHVYSNGNFVISDLILYYNPASYLSYPSAGTTINNLVGNSLNGVMSNITFTNPYFTFNGSNSQVTITDNSLLEPGSGDWTMEVWVNQTVSTGSQVILGKFDSGGLSTDVSYSIRVSNGNVRSEFGNGVTSLSTATYSLTTGTWYQLTYVFNNVANNNVITYVNGIRQSTNTHSFASVLNTASNLYLGSYNNGEYVQWFNGKIGITRIYNSALSSSEVLQNYNANAELYGLERHESQIVTDGLLLQLDANETSSYPGSGTTWYDISGNGSNMALVNTPTYVSGTVSYFDFNGTTQFATGTGVTVPTTAYTKSVWFWVDAYVANNIVSGYNNVGGHFLYMGNSTKILVGHHNQNPPNAFNTYQSTDTISLNTWYNVTVTFNTTSGFKIYINGQLDSSHNMTLAHLGSGTTNLASYGNTGDNFMNGRISKVYTYNRVLSATEILQNFDADRSQFGI
jgi:hypothetical protein